MSSRAVEVFGIPACVLALKSSSKVERSGIKFFM